MNTRGRPPDLARRTEILELAAEHLLASGLTDFSLRPVAAAIGGTTQLLMHHFGSKEQFLAEVIAHVDKMRREMLDAWLAAGDAPQDVAWQGWQVSTTERALAFERFRLHVLALALDDPDRHRTFLDAYASDGLDLIEIGLEIDGVPPEDRRVLATVIRAVLRGLLVDLLASDDRERVEEAAFHYFGAQLRAWMDQHRAAGTMKQPTRVARVTGSKPPKTAR